jgi:hypothetical protein
MNALKIGAHTKYTFKRIPELAIVSGFNRTATGRNVGQTNSVYAGLFYAVNLKKKYLKMKNNIKKILAKVFAFISRTHLFL